MTSSSRNAVLLYLALKLCLIGMIACVGCISRNADKAIKHMTSDDATKYYEEQLDPSIGVKTMDDFIMEWGPPTSEWVHQTRGGFRDVCQWRISHGTRLIEDGYWTGGRFGMAYQPRWGKHEMYDRLTLTFNNDGVLQAWRVYCER